MTVLVGIRCRDGVVIGADSSAMMVAGRQPTIEQPTNKIRIIDDRVIVAGTGEVGLGQRFAAVVESAWNEEQKPFQWEPLEVAKYLCVKGINDFASTNVQSGQFGALVAFPSKNRPHLCEFGQQNFQPELKTGDDIWYVSMGSGQQITDPFLGFMREVFWEDEPPHIQDGVFVVTWTLAHAIKLNPGGINGPMQIATLTSDKKGKLRASLLDNDELAEHEEHVRAATDHLRLYKSIMRGDNPDETPDIPAKPAQHTADEAKPR